MSEERYVDPNSGAAPQPGGWAGPSEDVEEVPSEDAQDDGNDEKAAKKSAAKKTAAKKTADKHPHDEPTG